MSQATPLSSGREGSRLLDGRSRAFLAGRAAATFLRSPEGLAVLAGLAFVAITVWWLGVDQASPDGDASRHFQATFEIRDAFSKGHLLHWAKYEPSFGALYPPLVYLIGLLGTLGGPDVDGPVLAVNLVSVPMLAAGTFGMARVAYGRAAGLPAVLFALATPVIIGQLHLFMLDVPLAAFVATSGWLLMASRRFGDWRLSVLAGVVVGAGLLVKQTLPIFVGPLVLVMLLRGGWRNWRNVLLFALPAIVIAGPWYIEHLGALRSVATAATVQGSGAGHNPFGTEYTRFSFHNFAWYGWTFVNVHYFLPLTLLYLAGVAFAVRDWVRRRAASWAPELIVGSLSGFVGVALVFGFQDARYSIPAVGFVAAVGGGWLARLARPWRLAGTFAVVAILVLNTVAVNTGALGRVDWRLASRDHPGVAGEGKLVLLGDNGYTARKPDRDARLLDVLDAARRRGITAFSWDPRPMTTERVNVAGLNVLATAVGLRIVSVGDRLLGSQRAISISRQAVPRGGPEPCTHFPDGTGLYLFRGGAGSWNPTTQHNLYCPL